MATMATKRRSEPKLTVALVRPHNISSMSCSCDSNRKDLPYELVIKSFQQTITSLTSLKQKKNSILARNCVSVANFNSQNNKDLSMNYL